MLLREGTKKWDSCAGEAILCAAGGMVSDAVGRRYRYDSNPATALNLSGIIVSADRVSSPIDGESSRDDCVVGRRTMAARRRRRERPTPDASPRAAGGMARTHGGRGRVPTHA